ncbi:MAG: hypothetical protein OEV35_08445, partial [Gallionellaceae bacterium]|nr:hypothetical protein [Gallionellaceae bacterium]
MNFTSITRRLALWFLLISLLPLLLAGYSLLHVFEQELQHTALRQISDIADRKVDQIDVYLNERVREAVVKIQSNTTRQAMQSFSAV